MRRRQFISRALGMGAGMLAGASAVEAIDHLQSPHLTAAVWASTISPAPVHGSAQVYWSAVPAPDRRLALTFDDGPTEQFTARVLDLLSAHRIVATFFVIGALVQRHPDLVRRIRDGGHEIGNHSFDHVSAAVSGNAAVRSAVLRGSEIIQQVTGNPVRWFRPPRGEITTATMLAAREAGLDLAMWSVDRGGAPDADSAGVGHHLVTTARPGDVIDLHDGIGRSSFSGWPDGHLLTRRRAEIASLPEVLSAWQASGYRFVTLSQLIPVA